MIVIYDAHNDDTIIEDETNVITSFSLIKLPCR